MLSLGSWVQIAGVAASLAGGASAASPRERGILAQLRDVLTLGRDAGVYPGATMVIGDHTGVRIALGVGTLDWTMASPSVTPAATQYDLASLTKVVATTTALERLVEMGRVDLTAPVQRYLPAFRGPGKARVTVADLLSHQGGLRVGLTDRAGRRSLPASRDRVLALPLACGPGGRPRYSDLGADVLGWIVEAVTGMTLDRWTDTAVFAPLGMAHTRWRPGPSPTVAPTESPRTGAPRWGVVHDDLAEQLGGVAGHAGLFSTADDLGRLAQWWLTYGQAPTRALGGQPTVVWQFTHEQAEHRAWGWEMATGTAQAGTQLSAAAYGHTGYTGTALWIDPAQDLFVVLLTNRVHAPRRAHSAWALRDIRADVVDLAVRWRGLSGAPVDTLLRVQRVGWGGAPSQAHGGATSPLAACPPVVPSVVHHRPRRART